MTTNGSEKPHRRSAGVATSASPKPDVPARSAAPATSSPPAISTDGPLSAPVARLRPVARAEADPKRRALSTQDASKPVARYSQGIAAAGLVFSAGQGAHDPVTNELSEGIEAEMRRALENVDAILSAGGASLASALKITVRPANRQDYAAMNAAYDAYMPDMPAVRTTVQRA